jgi:hypothetical protein
MQQIEQEKAGKASGSNSPTWASFLKRLGDTDKGAVGYGTAREIVELLKDFGHAVEKQVDKVGEISAPDTLDIARLEVAARRKFLPHVEKAKADFPLIERNMEYAYRRRNMRQTFVIALVVALVMSYPVQRLYDSASALTDEQAVAMTQQALDIFEKEAELDSTSTAADSLRVERKLKALNEMGNILLGRLGVTDSTDAGVTDSTGTERSADLIQAPILTKAFWDKKPFEWLCYLLGCFITAVLLSFGAPFWNDVAKSVLNLKKSMASSATSSPVTGSPATGTPASGNNPGGQAG